MLKKIRNEVVLLFFSPSHKVSLNSWADHPDPSPETCKSFGVWCYINGTFVGLKTENRFVNCPVLVSRWWKSSLHRTGRMSIPSRWVLETMYNILVNSCPLKWLESQHLQGEKEESKEENSKVFKYIWFKTQKCICLETTTVTIGLEPGLCRDERYGCGIKGTS